MQSGKKKKSKVYRLERKKLHCLYLQMIRSSVNKTSKHLGKGYSNNK